MTIDIMVRLGNICLLSDGSLTLLRESFNEFFMKKIHYASNFSVNVHQLNQRDQIMVVI